MSGWLRAVLLAVALMVGTWALLVLLAPPPATGPGLLRYLIGWHAEARPRSRTYNATANSANATASRLFAGSSTANS